MEKILPYIDPESQALLRPKTQLARAKAGQYIVREGKPASGLFIIQRGAVDILRNMGGNELFVTTLEKDALFGESAFLESLPASASARARVDTDLMVFTPQKISLLFEESPELFSQFFRSLALQLSRKLRVATGEAGNTTNDKFGDMPTWEIL
ncbi:MAG: cyclic nucleotide-binding domain-containing protein [Gammaproteobacteria bacterium]|nr:cyclic nucleotide-binding domain-containing protein [Gammaproteobacteria bacterium]